jgi:hypothetical protein
MRVLRKIFGLQRDEIRGDWRKLHNEEFCDFYFLPDVFLGDQIWRMRWLEHVAFMVEKRNAYRVLVWKQEGKVPLGRPVCG